MTADSKLAHSLKIKFGLPPTEPTATQLVQIKSAIQKIKAAGRQPTEKDWGTAVSLYCPGAGTCKYAGIDNSDLNTLLALALQSAKGK